ncbi:MAG: AAA family ATPase [Candidatus Schekmanbacteria bacterium RBG_16_38_10]|uniref:AAA family ATPase n=1 Tax=Candidatus Schekmanbacteria bacterium RBG_16_38_10 TaxID=1817879 RepID=A0A1F7RTU9_9BACT|nr:MAG: AAA family ATPase [Candidatus Schekmanbacteria bacterium RBG_16_38_10]
MIKRTISKKLKSLSSRFPVISVIGPRQSGKTTLVKHVFSRLQYVSLEDLDTRDFALHDPRGFLSTYNKGVIIDEVQRVPALFSYIQTAVDKKNSACQFILTGSQNILIQENISQTLAGRVAILKLLPLSLEELKHTPYELNNAEKYIFKGFYPRIYDKKIAPSDWYPNYIQTYVERDVRLLKNIENLNIFQKFVKMCAGRAGQILNLSSLGNECGITHNTARSWLSILESSYIIFFLKPYYRNFNKRLVKMPKLYFYDTGLLCSLLGIQNTKQLATHYLKGNLFESFVMSEITKERFNKGLEPNCYYWRDKTGNEIDCIIEIADKLLQVEIKSGKTVTSDFFDGLKYWEKVAGKKYSNPYLIYGGNEFQKRTQVDIISWKNIPFIFDLYK